MNLQDPKVMPALEEICEAVRNPLLASLCGEMQSRYQAICKVEFSRCSWAYGWNVKFKKAGKTLCTVYPKEGYFTALVVISAQEKEHVETILPQFSPALQDVYRNTPEGNGQRWLMIDLEDADATYRGALQLIDIRRGKKASGSEKESNR